MSGPSNKLSRFTQYNKSNLVGHCEGLLMFSKGSKNIQTFSAGKHKVKKDGRANGGQLSLHVHTPSLMAFESLVRDRSFAVHLSHKSNHVFLHTTPHNQLWQSSETLEILYRISTVKTATQPIHRTNRACVGNTISMVYRETHLHLLLEPHRPRPPWPDSDLQFKGLLKIR